MQRGAVTTPEIVHRLGAIHRPVFDPVPRTAFNARSYKAADDIGQLLC
jgi:hypothetical protein